MNGSRVIIQSQSYVSSLRFQNQQHINGIWRIYFRQKMLGYFDETKLRIMDEVGRLKRNNV